jgi:hypothetical protein
MAHTGLKATVREATLAQARNSSNGVLERKCDPIRQGLQPVGHSSQSAERVRKLQTVQCPRRRHSGPPTKKRGTARSPGLKTAIGPAWPYMANSPRARDTEVKKVAMSPSAVYAQNCIS